MDVDAAGSAALLVRIACERNLTARDSSDLSQRRPGFPSPGLLKKTGKERRS
jgi:hypothetical protein